MISKQLIFLRKMKGISQAKLSEDTNISQSAIAKWEKNKTEATETNIITLAKYFNVTTDYLLGLEDENQALSKNISNTEFNMSVEKASGTIENFSLNHKIKK